jgi:hypothetical protein
MQVDRDLEGVQEYPLFEYTSSRAYVCARSDSSCIILTCILVVK